MLLVAATEEGHERKSDEELLSIATASGRVLVTQDIRLRLLAEEWQRTKQPFAGLILAHQRRVSFGELVADLELAAKATDPAFWFNRVEQLPL